MKTMYRELSSLENDLGYSARQLYALSNTLGAHYHKTSIPKGNGEYRDLYVPDRELKALQRKIAQVVLAPMDISPYATAYRVGGSPLVNAAVHAGHECLLKMDVRHFFDKITYALVRTLVFPASAFSEPNSALLSALCCWRECLPQGAPTSPAVSNIIMRDFDNTVGGWCSAKGITYTRYCDDLTFSGSFDPVEVRQYVAAQLYKLGFFPNEKKTVFVRDGQKMAVTGIVVNRKPNASSAYKRKIRQEMYYCMKYGVAEHLKAKDIHNPEGSYIRKILGRVNYVLSIEPQNREFAGYKTWLLQAAKQ